jgi:hypothetical protein
MASLLRQRRREWPAADGGRRCRRPAEATIEVGDELGQVGLGGLDGGDAAQPQFTHEPVLERGPQALDAPLGLRRAGGDVADAELPQDGAQVAGLAGPRVVRPATNAGHCGPARAIGAG